MNETSNIPIWKVNDSHPDLVEKLKDSFRMVKDPEIGSDIIQLGLIRDVEVRDSEAIVTMILTTPYCPYGPAMLESARVAAEKAIGKSTTVIYGHEVWDQSLMEDPTAFDWGIF